MTCPTYARVRAREARHGRPASRERARVAREKSVWSGLLLWDVLSIRECIREYRTRLRSADVRTRVCFVVVVGLVVCGICSERGTGIGLR